jgi:RNA polymerase sigma factor (sigma-70 family)
MMFNNCNLPLNKAQKFQAFIAIKQPKAVHKNQEELSLLKAYNAGNEEAGWELFVRYAEIVSYIYRLPHKAQFKKGSKVLIEWTPQDREDLFQEIALHFFTLLTEYDPEQGELQGLIKGKLHLRVYDNFFEDVADIKINEFELNEDLDIEDKLRDILQSSENGKAPSEYLELYMALNELSSKQREVLELTIVKGWNASETAQEMGLKAPAVRKLKERALEKMTMLLTKED